MIHTLACTLNLHPDARRTFFLFHVSMLVSSYIRILGPAPPFDLHPDTRSPSCTLIPPPPQHTHTHTGGGTRIKNTAQRAVEAAKVVGAPKVMRSILERQKQVGGGGGRGRAGIHCHSGVNLTFVHAYHSCTPRSCTHITHVPRIHACISFVHSCVHACISFVHAYHSSYPSSCTSLALHRDVWRGVGSRC